METFTWIPDHEYKEDLDYDVDKTDYESGVQQRYLNNPDPIVHRFHLHFINRSNTEITNIVNFLKARKGRWAAFYYTGKFDSVQYTVNLASSILPVSQTSITRCIDLIFEVSN